LFGHLTPTLLQAELEYINTKLKDASDATYYITVFAMHIKPTFNEGDNVGSPYRKMREELDKVTSHFQFPDDTVARKLQPTIVIPHQTDMIYVDKLLSTAIDRHGSFVSAKADVHPMHLPRSQAKEDFESESDDDDAYGQRSVSLHGYQEHAYGHDHDYSGRLGYAPYSAMGYAPYVVDAQPAPVIASGAAGLLPIVLALGTLFCCVAIICGMFVCAWVFRRMSTPQKVPRFARLAANDQDDIEYGDRV